jgi:hypothetical protein
MSATARAATARPRTARRPAPPARATARRRPVLVEVPPAPAAVAGNGVFALVVVGLLLVGMGVLLGLNTSLAQGAFEINALTRTQSTLAVQEQQLLQQVAVAEAPESLQQRADALGMVPVASPVFLRLADGAVLGAPVPAAAARPRRTPGLPVTGVPAAGTAATVTSAAPGATSATPVAPATPGAGSAPARPVVAAAGADAAVADPRPGGQTDAAVPDTTATGAGR